MANGERHDSTLSPRFERTADGLTFAIRFLDAQPPHQVQADFERTLMTLFEDVGDPQRWAVHAQALVNGIRFSYNLSLEAATPGANVYRMQIDVLGDQAAWDPAELEQTCNGWLGYWLAGRRPAPTPAQNDPSRYAQLASEAAHANQRFDTPESIQQAIVQGMRSGWTFGTAHKEGGTSLWWRAGRFHRSDYGDNPGNWSFDESEFLAHLRQFFHHEAIRTAGPEGRSERDVWLLIYRRLQPPRDDRSGPSTFSTVDHGAPSPTQRFMQGRQRVGGCFGLIALALLVLALGAYFATRFMEQPFASRTKGSPLGSALRTQTHILQLLSTTEPYIPSLNRNPDRDRFRIDLLAVSISDPSDQRVIELTRQQQRNVLQPMTHILGQEGDVVWVQALDTFAVNLATGAIAKAEDFVRVNPQLGSFFQSAESEFDGRFIAVSRDGRTAYAIDPLTLRASPVPSPKRQSILDRDRSLRLESALASGGLCGSQQWIAALTADEAKSDFRPGSSNSGAFDIEEREAPRWIFGGAAELEGKRVRFRSQKRLETDPLQGATFVRALPSGGLLLSSDRKGVFVVHRQSAELSAPFVLKRLTLSGETVWSSPLGLGKLAQVLPGPDRLAFIGERPPVPNQVSEPLLVFVDAESGRTTTLSLWR